MNEIQRYALEPTYTQSMATMVPRVAIIPHPEGQVVLYTDHVAALARTSSPDPAREALVGALKEIAEWRMPDTGQTWPDGSPMSYRSLFGSNGERDYIISIAERALAEQGNPEDLPTVIRCETCGLTFWPTTSRRQS